MWPRPKNVCVDFYLTCPIYILSGGMLVFFSQLNGNSCYRVMCLMEVERAVCFYLLWPQTWYGNTSNEHALPPDARPSGPTFFGLMQQDVARYPRCSVSLGKTQFVLGAAGPTAGI